MGNYIAYGKVRVLVGTEGRLGGVKAAQEETQQWVECKLETKAFRFRSCFI